MKEEKQILVEAKLKVKKLTKEIELLALEVENFEKNERFSNRRISILIAIATLVISVTQIITSQISANKEIKLKQYENERRYEFDLVNFIVANQSDIFSSDGESRERVRNIMYVTFPEKILKVAFQKLQRAAKDKGVQEFWGESRKLTVGLEQIDSLIQSTHGQRGKIQVELWSNKNKGQQIGELLASADYQIVWVDSKNETPINSIWYDDDTSVENAKLIALFMINSGIGIKQIKKRKNTNGRTQIGSEPFFVKNPINDITLEKIMTLK